MNRWQEMALQWMILTYVVAAEAAIAILLTLPAPNLLKNRFVSLISLILQPALFVVPFAGFQLLGPCLQHCFNDLPCLISFFSDSIANSFLSFFLSLNCVQISTGKWSTACCAPPTSALLLSETAMRNPSVSLFISFPFVLHS